MKVLFGIVIFLGVTTAIVFAGSPAANINCPGCTYQTYVPLRRAVYVAPVAPVAPVGCSGAASPAAEDCHGTLMAVTGPIYRMRAHAKARRSARRHARLAARSCGG